VIGMLGTISAATTTFDVPANIAFGLLAAGMIFAAIRVVTTNNVVHAALWLVIVLGGVGMNFLLLQAEFVAMTQFLVYLGAIVVLFLFGIMLTRAPLGRSDDLNNNQRVIGGFVGLLLLGVIGYALIDTWGADKLTFSASEVAGGTSTQLLANSIFGDYLIPFEVVSVLLLAALIGAIVLARRD
jgi:NADH-quinone oxidoreductase subunit J